MHRGGQPGAPYRQGLADIARRVMGLAYIACHVMGLVDIIRHDIFQLDIRGFMMRWMT
jgi:hypothetical protein